MKKKNGMKAMTLGRPSNPSGGLVTSSGGTSRRSESTMHFPMHSVALS